MVNTTKWYENHPLITTLLWVLGGSDNKEFQNSNSTNELKTTTAIKTNDKKIHFEQNISNTKLSYHNSLAPDSHTTREGSVLLSTERTEELKGHDDKKPPYHSRKPTVKEDEENVSPAWGFYVAITPEANEMYSSGTWRERAAKA